MDTGPARRQEPWRVVVRTVVSAIVLAGVAVMLLVAFYYRAVECDDGCASDYDGDPVYAVQFWVACTVALLALGAILTGFVRRSSIYHGAIAGVVVGTVLWAILLFGRS